MSPLAAGNATILPIIWMTWRSIDSVPNKVYATARSDDPCPDPADRSLQPRANELANRLLGCHIYQAYSALAGALGRVPDPAHTGVTAAGRRWVFFRELAYLPCRRPDRYGKRVHIRDDATGNVVFNTRHPDFPAAFLRNHRYSQARRKQDSRFQCDADVRSDAPCVPEHPCPMLNMTLKGCQRHCWASSSCVALVHNV